MKKGSTVTNNAGVGLGVTGARVGSASRKGPTGSGLPGAKKTGSSFAPPKK